MVTINHPLYTGSGFRCLDGNDVPMFYTEEVDSLEQAIYDLLSDVRAVLGGPGSTITQMLGASAQQQQQIAVYSRGAAALGMLGSLIAPELGIPLALGAEVIAIANELDLGGDVEAPAQMPVSYTTGLTDGTYPVTPVTPPPEGYGGGDPADIVDAIFLHNVTWQNATGEVQLSLQYWLEEVMAALGPSAWASGVPDPRNPYFSLVAAYPTAVTYGALIPWSASAVPPVPALDFSAVLAGDTVLSYLNREVDDYTWTNQGPWGEATPAGVFAALSGEYAGRYWRCNLTDDELHLLAGQLGGASTAGAPVWPGLAGVTLGDPVPFDDVMEITGPMHGVLVDYTTPPQKTDKWTVESFSNYGHAGQLAFTSDNGYAEAWQYLQWDKQVYVPRALSEAATVLLRPIAGQEGTVTPFTLL